MKPKSKFGAVVRVASGKPPWAGVLLGLVATIATSRDKNAPLGALPSNQGRPRFSGHEVPNEGGRMSHKANKREQARYWKWRDAHRD